ncbi:PTS sugar transporter subunit IIA [Paramicrobacterium chengjingii]|uniref:Ascorbate-specific PTS system EIIA component n=1 Tax=Paramicrobacterium chengjingii TaxID=2769067 RepID=A0ABX6YHJ8_9MICO|nr:PTS sugar transporter subunit IIA [Microbacterium chengjingii]QPZ38180.1 PTS sugar transporter subunit IIA [Microbacterium chengjingii]
MITELLTRETLLADVTCDSWEELVDIAGAPLVSRGAVTPEFLDSIKETVTRYGSYMVVVDDIALFHGRPEAGVQRIALSLALLKHPVYLNEARITAAFVLAATDNDSHIDLMRELATGLGDDKLLQLLRTTGSPDDILNTLKRLEHRDEKP